MRFHAVSVFSAFAERASMPHKVVYEEKQPEFPFGKSGCFLQHYTSMHCLRGLKNIQQCSSTCMFLSTGKNARIKWHNRKDWAISQRNHKGGKF